MTESRHDIKVEAEITILAQLSILSVKEEVELDTMWTTTIPIKIVDCWEFIYAVSTVATLISASSVIMQDVSVVVRHVQLFVVMKYSDLSYTISSYTCLRRFGLLRPLR